MTDGIHESDGENLVDVSDGKWVPRERLDQVNGQLRDIRAEISELRKPVQEAVTLPSFTELVSRVEEGDLTQAEADEINAARTKKETVAEITEAFTESRMEEKHQTLLTDYISLVPDINLDGTDINKRIVQEYQDLVAMGLSEDTKTQVTAVRSVLGTPDFIRSKVKGQAILNTHEESGGGPGGDENQKSDWEKLTPRYQAHYDRAIDHGAYPDRDACVKEAKEAGLIG